MSDHSGNSNKMVSDTPRTDAAEKHAYEFKDEYTPVCESKLVRQLERELNSANQIIRQQQLLEEENLRLTAKVAQLYEGAEEQRKRIQRLEEAGDFLSRYLREMPYASDYLAQVDERILRISNWRRAKEDNL